MQEHLKEQQLEWLILHPEQLDEEARQSLRTHLDMCSLCREHFHRLELVFGSVADEIEKEPSQRDRDFAKRLLERERRLAPPARALAPRTHEGLYEVFETYAEAIEVYRGTALQRFIRWVRIHPVRFATASAFFLAALVLLTMTVRKPKDTNPVLAEVKKGVLRVYNKQGEELWSRTALKIPDGSTPFGFEHSPLEAQFVTIQDIDGNGRSVVLVTGLTTSSREGLDSLFCFEGNGELRWRVSAGSFTTFGKKGIGLAGEPAFMALAFPRAQRSRPRLFALVGSVGFSPAKVIELDPSTGSKLQAYHHRGGCNILQTADIDEDGNDELVVGGLNDGFDQACVAVLDPADISGHAPVPPDLAPLEPIPPAKEKYYLLFARTDLGIALGRTPYNQVSYISVVGNSRINVHVREGPNPPDDSEVGAVVYAFTKNMKLESVTGDDTFVTKYNKYYSMKESIQFKLEYWNALKHSVQYWDGEKFVHTPTMNRRYGEIHKPLP